MRDQLTDSTLDHMSKIQNGFYHKSDNIWQEISGKHAGNTDTKNVTVILITRPQPSHYYRIRIFLSSPARSRVYSRVGHPQCARRAMTGGDRKKRPETETLLTEDSFSIQEYET